MKRVVILSGGHLCRNPRVIKEAAALREAGLDVEVLGGWTNASLADEDRELAARYGFRYTPAIRLDERGPAALIAKAERWTTRKLAAHAGLELPSALGYGVRQLFREAQSRAADLYIAHSESALWGTVRLARLGCKVGLDMEDWFSEDLPTEARIGRPVELLRRLERELLQRAVHTACPSAAMSRALAESYGCTLPAVVYNAFPWQERAELDGRVMDRSQRAIPSLHWYSQTLGPGRGLDDLIRALPFVSHPLEIHLRGGVSDEFRQWIAASLPERWRERVFIHGLVSNRELLSRIAEHDIGFAGENSSPRNRDLTVTNKILHYLLGGLAVVASATTGQAEVAARAGRAVRVYASGNPHALALELNALLASPEDLRAARAAALEAAQREFSWEMQAPVLLRSIRSAIGE